MDFGGASFNNLLIDRLGRIFPGFFWERYNIQSHLQGFDRLYLLLSFDCDTPADAEAASKLDEWLVERGIQRSYAVPGTMLEDNPAVYQKIASKGAEFLNHGYLPHTLLTDGVYHSTTFYDQMEPGMVVDDVRKGHETVQRIIGKSPAGFRAPHFGTVSLQTKREIIQPVLKELGEFYTSHSTPFEALKYGPIWWENNWPEFPVIGSASAPFSILDSYSYIQSPAVRKVTGQFSMVLKQTIRSFEEWGIHGLMNMYVDPSHVIDDPGFLASLDEIHNLGILSLTYTQALEIGSGDSVG